VAAVDNIIAARDSLAQLVKQETALMLTNGARPDYNLDGESFNWDQWLEKMQARIEGLTRLIPLLSDPWEIRSRGVSR
jgi:hypothetical protein